MRRIRTCAGLQNKRTEGNNMCKENAFTHRAYFPLDAGERALEAARELIELGWWARVRPVTLVNPTEQLLVLNASGLSEDHDDFVRVVERHGIAVDGGEIGWTDCLTGEPWLFLSVDTDSTHTKADLAACRERGWYAIRAPVGYRPCDADTPGAIEDLNRWVWYQHRGFDGLYAKA